MWLQSGRKYPEICPVCDCRLANTKRHWLMAQHYHKRITRQILCLVRTPTPPSMSSTVEWAQRLAQCSIWIHPHRRPTALRRMRRTFVPPQNCMRQPSQLSCHAIQTLCSWSECPPSALQCALSIETIWNCWNFRCSTWICTEYTNKPWVVRLVGMCSKAWQPWTSTDTFVGSEADTWSAF